MSPRPNDAPPPATIAVLLPHAPILVPAVAGGRAQACAATTAAMREAARRLVASRPETVVLLSPHSPRAETAFGLATGRLSGSLSRFGAPQAAVAFPADEELRAAIVATAGRSGLAVVGFSGHGLDHGAVVPLWFLAEAGWKGPVVIAALSGWEGAGVGGFGEAVAEAARATGRRIAIVGSGDMSHRLAPGAPSGYDPGAVDFDAGFIARLRAGATRGLADGDAGLRERAAEDVVDATLFAVAAAGWDAAGRDVLGYEGPFGVGYGVAVLYTRGGDDAAAARLPGLARESIAAALDGRAGAAPGFRCATAAGAGGLFVTLHTADGRLRGCIGTLAPSSQDRAAETWRMAREAAFHDPRFPPLRADELAGVSVEVTLLESPEEIAGAAALDPRRWGVIVTGSGGRRGVLLPDLPGVNSVEAQLDIARRKAGIDAAETVRLQRFGARRWSEPAGAGRPGGCG